MVSRQQTMVSRKGKCDVQASISLNKKIDDMQRLKKYSRGAAVCCISNAIIITVRPD